MRMLYVLRSVAFCLLCGATAWASPASYQKVQQGFDFLKQEKYEEALKQFEAAEALDVKDAQAIFFQGVALNRLGRHAQALEDLQKAEKMQFPHSELSFELGWALLKLGKHPEAIKHLEAYEASSSTRGQTLEFLGRAKLELGNYQEAKELFRNALERDPELLATIEFSLATIESRQGRAKKSFDRLQSLTKEQLDTPVSNMLRRYFRELGPVSVPRKRWRLSLTSETGWNDNVIALGDGQTLPTDISGKGSGFGRFSAQGAYTFIRTDSNVLTGGYNLQADIYEDSLNDSNVIDHYWNLNYQYRWTKRLLTGFRLADQYTVVGGDSFRNRISGRPSIFYRFSDAFGGEVAYIFSTDEYYFDSSIERDRDGETHTVSATAYYSIPSIRWNGRMTYSHEWANPDGQDFERDSDSILLGLNGPLFWNLSANMTYVHLLTDYKNSNSFTGFTTTRDDNIDVVRVQISRPVKSLKAVNARIFIQYEHTRDDSNIEIFKYRQDVYSAGFSVRF